MSQLSGNQMFRKLNDLMRNVVPGKDLTSSDSYLRDGHDSAFESTQQMNSQMNNSQYEFSQINSQDLFTQQYSSGSQSEISMPIIPNRRPSMYDKWMSKGPSGSLYKGPQGSADSKPNSYPSKPLSVPSKPDLNPQQLQLNKNKAKERDERDLLQQVATVVQECTKEIKSSVNTMKDKIQHSNDLSSDKIQDTISSFLSELCQQQDRILTAVKEKENRMLRLNQLEKEMATKDATISNLEKQLEDRIESNNDNMIKTLKKEIKEPTLALDKKVNHVIEWMNEETETSNQQIIEYKQQTEIQKKFNLESRQKQQKNMKDTELRILEELNVMKQDLKYHEENWQKQCLVQLHHAQEGQFRNLQKQLVNVFERNKNKCTGNSNSAGTNLQAEVIEDIFKSQWQSVEIFLESQFNRQIDVQEQQLDKLLEKFTETQEKSVVLARKEPDYRLSLPYFEEHFSKYHSDVKKQIEDLHEKHQSEIQRIEEELKQQRLAKEKEEISKSTSLQVVPSLQTELHGNRYLVGSKETSSSAFDRAKAINPPPRQYPKSSGYTLPPTRHSPFSSYGPLNSRTLFSKSYPSPIAAVLPQRKEICNSSLTKSIVVPSEPLQDIPSEGEESQTELLEDFVETEEEEKPMEEIIKPVENKPQAKKGKKRKRKKGTFSRKKAKPTTNKCTRRSIIERELGITEVSEEWQKPRTLRSSTIKTNETSKNGQMAEKTIIENCTSNGISRFRPNLTVHSTAPAITISNSNQIKLNSNQTKNTISPPMSIPTQNQSIVSQTKPIYKQNESVYDFEDDCQPSSVSFRNPQTITYDRRLLNNDKPKQYGDNNRITIYNSPTRRSICTYGTSRESSPSMSLTEVVIKRKIKCDNKKTPDLRNFNHAQSYNYEQCSQISRRDILGSSPNLDIFSKQSRDLQEDLQEPIIYPAPTRNVTEKHGSTDSNYVEITESIRRRTQKRYFQFQNYEE